MTRFGPAKLGGTACPHADVEVVLEPSVILAVLGSCQARFEVSGPLEMHSDIVRIVVAEGQTFQQQNLHAQTPPQEEPDGFRHLLSLLNHGRYGGIGIGMKCAGGAQKYYLRMTSVYREAKGPPPLPRLQ